MKKVEKNTRYTNLETGEYHDKKILVDMQFDEQEGYLFWNQKSSIKTFLDMPLPKEFTWSERGRINELKHYMMQDSQLLVYRSGNFLKPISHKELSKILELSDRQAKVLIKKMKRYGIVKEVKANGIVYLAYNPIYGLKAKRVTLLMFLWFQDEFVKVMPVWAINKFLEQAKELKPDITIIK
jgi:hypothetical protein